jgi:hypothetical protein
MNRREAAILEGELEARRLTLSFLWKKRFFALYADFSFCRYNGAELRHSAAITQTTSVSKRGDREFVLAFVQPELRYHIRAASADLCDRWVAALQSCIQRASAPAPSQPAAAPSSSPAPRLLPTAAPSSAPPLPAVNFATEWLDELGCVCPKAVDYASQCPKGHALAPLAGGGCGAAAQRVMCRVCHTCAEREHASQWLACSVTGCCAGYAVCNGCVRALQQAPAAAAGGHDFPSLVCVPSRTRARGMRVAFLTLLQGVAVLYLLWLKSALGAWIGRLTVEQACQMIIKPRTSRSRGSLVSELLQHADTSQHVGEATWFISHT